LKENIEENENDVKLKEEEIKKQLKKIIEENKEKLDEVDRLLK
jgi:hypothetical protein